MFKNKVVEKYVQNLKDTDNIGTTLLYSKRDYLELYKVVMDVLKKNKDASIEEIREQLYERSGLENVLRKIYLEQLKAPGAVISFGTFRHQDKFVIGNKQEIVINDGKIDIDIKEMQEDTIFDIASCTKVFTSIVMLRLSLRSDVSLNDKVTKYAPQFKNLDNVTLYDLLTFIPLITERRIDNAKSIEEAENILFTARVKTPSEKEYKDRYNDIAPMVLKYVIEKIIGMPFDKYIHENILDKLGMNDTHVKVPSYKLDKVANSNYAISIIPNGGIDINANSPLGVATDKKAVVLGQPEGILSGHAGLFSSIDDMVLFAKGMAYGLTIRPALYREMAKNRTPDDIVKFDGFKYTPSYGYLCNVKNNDPRFALIYPGLSGQSIGQTGWSGSFIAIDPLNKINVNLLSNRTHNRIVSIDPNARHRLPVGLVDSSNYWFDRKTVTDACSKLALQEKMLEDIVGEENVPIETNKVRILK